MVLVSAGHAQAQKNIIISDELALNSEKHGVKMGTQWLGRIWRIRFGEYAVVDSKMGWTTTSTRRNFLATKIDTETTQKFSFVLSNQARDTARVNAAENIRVQSLHELKLLPHFSWGRDEVEKQSQNFFAFITINGDTTDIWTLFMHLTAGTHLATIEEAFFTNGSRSIVLSSASSSNAVNDKEVFPAQGYTFTENGKALCAVQYRAAGAFGMNKNVVWIDKSTDTKTKLFLAAAMTAVLQIKATTFD